MAERVFIGVGNRFRGDDCAGLEAADRMLAAHDVQVVHCGGDPAAIMSAWEGSTTVVAVDAVVSGAEVGTIVTVDATAEKLPACFTRSTHALGLGHAVELARAIGRLPPRLVLFGIEGACFDMGAEADARVKRATAEVAARATEVLGA